MKSAIGLGVTAAVLGACFGMSACVDGETSHNAGGAAGADVPAPTPETRAALQRLESETHENWSLLPGAGGAGVRHLAGRTAPLLSAAVGPEQATMKFLAAHQDLFGIAEPSKALMLKSLTSTDAVGLQHARFTQSFAGIEVFGRELIAHFDATGALVSMSADTARGLDGLNLSPALGETEALALALGDAQRERPELDAKTASRPSTAKLVVFVDDAERGHLAWHVQLHFVRVEGVAPTMPVRMIDAATGEVLLAYDNLQTASAPVTVAGSNVPRTVTIQQQAGQAGQAGNWVLVDDTRASGKVSTRNANYGVFTSATMPFVSSAQQTSGWDPAGVDAQFGAEYVYDFYKTRFNRDSFDGRGGALNSFVHVGDPRASTSQARQKFNNAYWDGDSMNYGDGDGALLTKLSAGLDVCAHELSHGVTGALSGLVYQSESGALNEAISDMFGAMIEHELVPDLVRNAQIGEDVVGPRFPKPAFRYLDRPAAGEPAQPASYRGPNWYSGAQDNGGVHINSGVANNAFWIMTVGARNPDTRIGPASAIGWRRAGELWYNVNASYLRSTSRYADAARATLDAAVQLSFSVADQNIIECAWIAVGVLQGTCKNTAGGSGGAAVDPGDGGTGPGPTPRDGGVVTRDAGVPVRDAGVTRDAGIPREAGAGVDAGKPEPIRDAGTPRPVQDAGLADAAGTPTVPNAGEIPLDPKTGCGCRTAGSSSAPNAPAAVAGLGLLAGAIARRRRKTPS